MPPMKLTRFEVLALLPDELEITGYQILVSSTGRVSLQEWQQDYVTVVEGLPENLDARLVWHRQQTELGLLILVKIGANPQTQVSFYLKPDPTKIKKRYRINPFRPKTEK